MLSCQIECSGCLNGVRSNLRVWKGSVVLLLPGDTLDVHSDHPLVGEHHMNPNVLVTSDDLLILDQDITHLGVKLGSICFLKFKDACITEVNPIINNYLVTIGLPSASMSGVRPAPWPDLTIR